MSFDDTMSSSDSSRSGGIKFPFQRLELSISRFTKALTIDLDRLHQHQNNILKFKSNNDSKALHHEQVNASRTCLQIKSNIKQLEQTRARLEPGDIKKFDERVSEIKMRAIVEVMEFLNVHGNNETTDAAQQETSSSSSPSSSSPADVEADSLLDTQQLQASAEAHSQAAEAEHSWKELENSLVELNGLVQHFSEAVSTQQEAVDRIEENIESSHQNVQEGTEQLAMGAKLRSAILPVAGAVVGGVLGGPIGLMAGIKLGGLAAMGGALTGAAGGLLVKQKQDEAVSAEVDNLREREESSNLELL